MTLTADDPRHGTVNGYNNLKCRCGPCTEAWRIYYNQYCWRTGRHMPMPVKKALTKALRAHGYNKYKRDGCRCDKCRAGAAAQKRRQRANNAEHYREKERLRNQRRKKAALADP